MRPSEVTLVKLLFPTVWLAARPLNFSGVEWKSLLPNIKPDVTFVTVKRTSSPNERMIFVRWKRNPSKMLCA
ncbi:uncharacterized protein K452DRAFT_1818 [Aplosporella prunicola CBS 121167]|uniref:Secreted protein n=1 Tax=Aplosporella prunicola CBS 121167 TaxID=1176127 RepID=A0A6A6BSZ5_9PEZI|nr:uncharacterized protein K452DRAFT_1818 [Aplosporella prunicola CBS 121167]KAF2147110.1 hypothetical protein K452DRAFT_1818 [Aplosporella prunicola CBS 121167]